MPSQGQTLTAANTLTDLDGIPTSGTGAITYQWLADGVAISGVIGSTLVLGQTQVGKAISVTASYTDVQGTPEAVSSSNTTNVANIDDQEAVVAGHIDPVAFFSQNLQAWLGSSGQKRQ